MIRTLGLVVLIACSSATAETNHKTLAAAAPPARLAVSARTYGALPLTFEPNQGQTNSEVRFLARTGGYTLFLTDHEAILSRTGADQVRVRPVGGRKPKATETLEPTGGTSNYFFGKDPSKWRTGIPHYRKIVYTEVYPGVNLTFYGNPQKLEYDFTVAAWAEPKQIQMEYDGAKALSLDKSGDLIIHTDSGDLIQPQPRAYQQIAGRRTAVTVHYHLAGQMRVAFSLGPHDKRSQLTIDPVLTYSTLLGGSFDDDSSAIAVDNAGSAYILGLTRSLNFPVVQPFQSEKKDPGHATTDAFVTKLNPSGTAIVYSTYLGGSSDDEPYAIAVDSSGSAFVTGSTNSTDFPIANALQPNYAGSTDVFVTKLSPLGSSLVYSTFLGGEKGEVGSAIALDPSGAAYIGGTTSSSGFPTKNAYQAAPAGGTDGFLSKINPAGTALVFSTFYGGTGDDVVKGLARDTLSGAIVVTGLTTSSDLPVLNAFQNTRVPTSSSTAFVTKFNNTGSGLVYSTYLGGSIGDGASAVALDSTGAAYVVGFSGSSDFPTTPNAIEPIGTGCFVAKLGTIGSLLSSTTLSGRVLGYCTTIAVDTSGNVLVAGSVSPPTFPLFAAFEANSPGPVSAFVAKLAPDLSAIIYATTIGSGHVSGGAGLALDISGNAYVVGNSYGTYPIVNSSKLGSGGSDDVGVSKIVDDAACASTTVSPRSFTFGLLGGPGIVNVKAPAGCIWNAIGDVGYVGMESSDLESSHIGNGTVSFTVITTSYGPTTTGYLVIAGKRVDITQQGYGCSYSLNQSHAYSPREGGYDQTTVLVSSGCLWHAESNVPWITVVSRPDNSGSDKVDYGVAPNPGDTRTGSLTIAGRTFTVTQGPIARDFTGSGRSGALLYDPATGVAYTDLIYLDGSSAYISSLFTAGFDILRTGDYNGDGKADLVLYNSHTALAYIGMGNGYGNFAFQSLFWSPGYDLVEPGDLDGDGKTDFALYNSSTGTMYTGISNGTGGFSYKYTLISKGYTFIRLADFSGDGKADIFLYNAINGLAFLGIGDGQGSFSFKPLFISAGYNLADLGELNGDGKSDILLYNRTNGNAATGISDGAGGFTFTPMSFSPGFTSVRLADYTGDGKADVTVYNKDSAAAYLGIGTGLGTFNFQSLFWSPSYDVVEPEDVNGDGRFDVLLYNSATGTEYTGLSNGLGGFTYSYSLWGLGKVLAR